MAMKSDLKFKTDFMGFLDSPQVKQSIEEAEFLRARLAELTELVNESKGTDLEVALEYLHTVYGLVEKEHSLHTRFRLSGDSEALIAAAQLDGARIAATDSDFINGDHFYRKLKEDIRDALRQLDDTDLDEPFDDM